MGLKRGRTLYKEQTITKTQVKLPSKYSVFLECDNLIDILFAKQLLKEVFHKTNIEITKCILDLQQRKKCFCGIYTKDVALTKQRQVYEEANKIGSNIFCTIREEDE